MEVVVSHQLVILSTSKGDLQVEVAVAAGRMARVINELHRIDKWVDVRDLKELHEREVTERSKCTKCGEFIDEDSEMFNGQDEEFTDWEHPYCFPCWNKENPL